MYHLIRFFLQLCELADNPHLTDKEVNVQRPADASQDQTAEVQSQDIDLCLQNDKVHALRFVLTAEPGQPNPA